LFTLQINPGFYCSDLINDRYQILESTVLTGSYYIFDHVKDKIIYQGAGGYYFNTVDAALKQCSGGVATKKPSNIAPIVTKPVPVSVPVVNIPPVVVTKAPEVTINKPNPIASKFAGAFSKFKKV